MIKQRVSIRPALARAVQEYLHRRKEFNSFKNLDHPYLVAAWVSGSEGDDKSFEKWREKFAKEENEKNKRSRSTQTT